MGSADQIEMGGHGSEENKEELIMLVSDYPELYNKGLASYKENKKKNWAQENTKLYSHISPCYVSTVQAYLSLGFLGRLYQHYDVY